MELSRTLKRHKIGYHRAGIGAIEGPVSKPALPVEVSRGSFQDKKSLFLYSAPYFRSREFFVFFHTTLQKKIFMGLKSKFER